MMERRNIFIIGVMEDGDGVFFCVCVMSLSTDPVVCVLEFSQIATSEITDRHHCGLVKPHK